MDKFAQRKGLLNLNLLEKLHPSGIAEKLFNPEFSELMNKLRESDDKVRGLVTGEFGSDSTPFKVILKEIEKNINRREYMKAIADLGRFHKRLLEIKAFLSSFSENLDKVHEKFLLTDLDETSKEHLRDIKKRLSFHNSNDIRKVAGIIDMITNIGTERGRALKAWENAYPHRVKALKSSLSSLHDKSENLLSTIVSSLKTMYGHRARRKVDDYIKESQKLVKAIESYDSMFKNFYNTHVKTFIDKLEMLEKLDPNKSENASLPPTAPLAAPVLSKDEPAKSIDIPLSSIEMRSVTPGSVKPATENVTPVPVAKKIEQKLESKNEKEFMPFLRDSGKLPPVSGPATAKGQNPPSKILEPKTDRSPIVNPDTERGHDTINLSKVENEEEFGPGTKRSGASHNSFIECLESMSNVQNDVLIDFILKYADSIREKDYLFANKLYKIAKLIEV